MGERIRPDLGLQLCMTVALLLGAAVTVALAVGLVWLTLFSHGGYGVTAMLACAPSSARRRRRRPAGAAIAAAT
jgi:hypothetical protein